MGPEKFKNTMESKCNTEKLPVNISNHFEKISVLTIPVRNLDTAIDYNQNDKNVDHIKISQRQPPK